jgi:hypothetical protein
MRMCCFGNEQRLIPFGEDFPLHQNNNNNTTLTLAALWGLEIILCRLVYRTLTYRLPHHPATIVQCHDHRRQFTHATSLYYASTENQKLLLQNAYDSIIFAFCSNDFLGLIHNPLLLVEPTFCGQLNIFFPTSPALHLHVCVEEGID